MRIIRRRGWEIRREFGQQPEFSLRKSNRRSLLQEARPHMLAAAPLSTVPGLAFADQIRNIPPGRPRTEEKYATTYSINYYEFSESKNLWQQAQAMKTSPWFDRVCRVGETASQNHPSKDLLKQVSRRRERIYRHRLRRSLGHDGAVDRISDDGIAETGGTFGVRRSIWRSENGSGQNHGRSERTRCILGPTASTDWRLTRQGNELAFITTGDAWQAIAAAKRRAGSA